jgi:hypothetical protein
LLTCQALSENPSVPPFANMTWRQFQLSWGRCLFSKKTYAESTTKEPIINSLLSRQSVDSKINRKQFDNKTKLSLPSTVPVYFYHATRSLSKSIRLWLTLVWAHGVQASFTTVCAVDVVFPSSQYLNRSSSATTRFFYNHSLVQKTHTSAGALLQPLDSSTIILLSKRRIHCQVR